MTDQEIIALLDSGIPTKIIRGIVHLILEGKVGAGGYNNMDTAAITAAADSGIEAKALRALGYALVNEV